MLSDLWGRLTGMVSLLWREVAKFGTVGAAAFVVDSLVFWWMMTGPLEGSNVKAKIVGGVVATLFSWVANRYWTFRDKRSSNKTRELVIVSGPARIWGSADCVDPKPRMLLLAAGQSDAASLTWKRVRSEPGCPTKGVEAKAGTYRATASILGKTSDEVVLVLS